MQRRKFILNMTCVSAAALASFNAPALPPFLLHSDVNSITARIKSIITAPVIIENIELLRTQGQLFVRVRSRDGAMGITMCNERMENLYSLLKGLVIPFYTGKDARNIESLCEDVLLDERNYKYGGMPFWNCAGTVEIAIWDLLGNIAQKPVYQLLGEQKCREIPVYLSSLTRNTTAEQEVAFLQQQLEASGASAVKIKVGGRMRNTSEAEARTQALMPLARKVLGDNIIIYADANGSYTAEEGIRIARLLEAHGVDIFEEPCAWEDYDANRQVNKTLTTMKLAGGEQDTSYFRFKEIAETNVYSILQPDVYYNGGILRTLKIALLAAQHNKYFAPHSPKADPLHAPFSQLIAVAPAVYGFQEYPARPKKQPNWYAPHILVKNGKLPVLTEAGLGIQYDETIFAKAERL
ncbi:MAG TPA: mandelate racemase/muconate lactonizing enzyme family protein [Saprospiraceae bacterium]|nr:mandelate racemase/muconate lactonizing enzyme family protein [Saprospiraceae bacterium]HMP25249.1 mandelate racemase/muconate lactonizing enzyme family protein [Saprospiraceae bacterium]